MFRSKIAIAVPFAASLLAAGIAGAVTPPPVNCALTPTLNTCMDKNYQAACPNQLSYCTALYCRQTPTLMQCQDRNYLITCPTQQTNCSDILYCAPYPTAATWTSS